MCGFKPIPSSKALVIRSWPRPKAIDRRFSVAFMAYLKLEVSTGSPAMSTLAVQDEVLFNSKLSMPQLAPARPKYLRIAAIRAHAVVLCSTPVVAKCPLNPGCVGVAFAPRTRPNHEFCPG